MCSTITTASAPRGSIPPVAIGVATPVVTVLAGHDAGGEDFVVQPHRARLLLHRPERVARQHGEAVDVGAVEAGYVDVRQDVLGEHAVQRVRERHRFPAERREPQVPPEARGRLVAADDGQELRLAGASALWSIRAAMRYSYRYTVTSASGP